MTVRSSVLALLALGLSATKLPGQTVGPANPLIRNSVPTDWQAADVQWSRDVAPHNKIDDLIDGSSDAVVDLIVNFNRCIRQTDLDALAQLSPEGRVMLKGNLIPFVSMAAVERSHVAAIAALPQVAFVEQKFGFGGSLDTSVANIRVTKVGDDDPNTVQNKFPDIDGCGVNIAILDTGVDDPGRPGITHVTFPSPAVAHYDAVTGAADPNANPDDEFGHGTAVASVALGRGLPGTTTTGSFPRGVAPGAGLVDVRIAGSNAFAFCQSPAIWDDTVRGLEQIYLNHAAWDVQVVNMSFRQCRWNFRLEAPFSVVSDGLDAFSRLVDLAESMGIVAVAAAANDGPENVGLPTPGAASRAITVAASDDHNLTDRSQSTIAGFSNRGPRHDDGDDDFLDELKPDVTAPGTNIAAAVFNTTSERCPFGAVTLCDGTSVAAPHVAGLAALILQKRRGMHPASVKQLLIRTAERKGDPDPRGVDGWSREWGFGLVNGFAAIDLLRRESERADLTFPHFPAMPAWLSQDISTLNPPKVGVANEARVQIVNRGPNTARNVRVQFGVADYSVAIPVFHDIGTVIVEEIAKDEEKTVSIPWTPKSAGHLCLHVQIGYGPDTDPANNVTQRNLRVAESPVTFEVRNTLTEEPAEIRFVPTFDPPTSDWTVTITPPAVTLAADDCPVQVEVLLTPLPTAAPGSVQRVGVAALIGDVLLGGVTVEETAPNRNVPDGAQAGMTTTGALRQLVPALSPGQTCTARLWAGKRSDGGGTWGSWYLQLASGPWVETLLNGFLSFQSVEWQQYQKSFNVPAYFPAGTISLQLTGYAGFESYDLVELDCGGGNLIVNGSFEIPAILDGRWSAFSNPPPAFWTVIPGAGPFNPNEVQLNNVFP